MKKLLLLLWIIPVLGFGQGKTIAFQKNMMIFNGQQSMYYLDTSSTAQAKSGNLSLGGSLNFTGTYTDDVIDFSNITIDYTGSSGPAPIRMGTYDSPMTNADEDQSGLLRLYGQTSANGTNYDRGVFVALKTTGTKGVMPIAGLAEVLAQSGDGPTNVHAGEFITNLFTATSKIADDGRDHWAGNAAIWAKIASKVGSTTAIGSVSAPIWADNQMSGTVNGEEYAFYVTSSTEPDAVFGFEASASQGYDQLFYWDETCYNLDPISTKSLKVKVNATQYYIPLSASDAAFTAEDGTVSLPGVSFADDLDNGMYRYGTDAVSIGAGGVEAVRFVESTTTQALFGPGTNLLPSISFIGDPNTGFYNPLANQIYITMDGSAKYSFNNTRFATLHSNAAAMMFEAPSSTNPVFVFDSDQNTGMGWAGADSVSVIAGSVEGIRIAEGGGKIKATVTDTLEIGGDSRIQQTTTTTANSYHSHMISEWTAGADMASGGSNGIYSISNPVKDVNNAYALRGRMDLRDAGAAVDVNQLHAIDALINFNTSHVYDIVDNLSVIGAAVHGNGADITGHGVLEEESLNLFYGVWGPTATQNFEITTNGLLLISHAGTYLDYGTTIENSGAMTAGLYLNNHASNSSATMGSGILIESAAGNMTYGINMTGASITMADILFQNGATADNIEADTLTLTETVVKVEGDLYVTGNVTQSHYGGMTYISTPGTQTIGTGGTFEKLFEGAMAYTAAHLDTFTESDGRLTYNGAVTKHFQILVFATIEGDEAAQLIQIRIAKDGTTIAETNQGDDFTAADSKHNLSTGWLMELAQNEYIEIYGTSDTNADTFEVLSLQLIISQMD